MTAPAAEPAANKVSPKEHWTTYGAEGFSAKRPLKSLFGKDAVANAWIKMGYEAKKEQRSVYAKTRVHTSLEDLLTQGAVKRIKEKHAPKASPVPENVQWKVHTPSLLQESVSHSNQPILSTPIAIFGRLLAEVGERAAQLNDARLNALMCRLTIYAIADPTSKDYDEVRVAEVDKLARASEESGELKASILADADLIRCGMKVRSGELRLIRYWCPNGGAAGSGAALLVGDWGTNTFDLVRYLVMEARRVSPEVSDREIEVLSQADQKTGVVACAWPCAKCPDGYLRVDVMP